MRIDAARPRAQGDKRAIQIPFARHQIRVYRLALRLINDEAGGPLRSRHAYCKRQ